MVFSLSGQELSNQLLYNVTQIESIAVILDG